MLSIPVAKGTIGVSSNNTFILLQVTELGSNPSQSRCCLTKQQAEALVGRLKEQIQKFTDYPPP